MGPFDDNDEEDLDAIRSQIERIKQESVRRLNQIASKLEMDTNIATNLNKNPNTMETTQRPDNTEISTEKEAPFTPTTTTTPKTQQGKREDVASSLDRMLNRIRNTDTAKQQTNNVDTPLQSSSPTNTRPVSPSPSSSSQPSVVDLARLLTNSERVDAIEASHLLDNTQWKLMLNIGRERGTWMPKTWGTSGQRLLISLQVEFTPDQYFEKEEFFGNGGRAGARKLRIVDNEVKLSASLTNAGRTYKVRDGGWKVGLGEGPADTDILRFFFDIDEEIRHDKSDLWCPAGRVYLTCGYFPRPDTHTTINKLVTTGETNSRPLTPKERIQSQLKTAEKAVDAIEAELQSGSLSVWDNIGKRMELTQAKTRRTDLIRLTNIAKIRQPSPDLLRFSPKGDVGLTKDGGVCCKVAKGLSVEYHILGKFQMANPERKDI